MILNVYVAKIFITWKADIPQINAIFLLQFWEQLHYIYDNQFYDITGNSAFFSRESVHVILFRLGRKWKLRHRGE